MRRPLILLALSLLCVGAPARAAELTVSAAASLTGAFQDIARAYQAHHPGARVRLNFGGSGALLQQIAKGAPVDVFASADQETMDLAAQQRLIEPASRRDFASNALVLVVPADSSCRIDSLNTLAEPGIDRIAIGNPASVPVGRYSRQALQAAGLWEVVQHKAINTQNVRQSLDYVARGEVDAGFVYATDAAYAGERVRIALRVPLEREIRYPVARIADSAQAAEAERFLEYLSTAEARAVLARHGFGQVETRR